MGEFISEIAASGAGVWLFIILLTLFIIVILLWILQSTRPMDNKNPSKEGLSKLLEEIKRHATDNKHKQELEELYNEYSTISSEGGNTTELLDEVHKFMIKLLDSYSKKEKEISDKFVDESESNNADVVEQEASPEISDKIGIAETLPVATDLQPNEVEEAGVKRHFYCHFLQTAGPTKGNEDVDLGEDSAGFVFHENSLLFWVLDGTSSSAKINIGLTEDEQKDHKASNFTIDDKQLYYPYFSSRLLTQVLASMLKLAYTKEPGKDIKELVHKALHDTIEFFQKKFDALAEKNNSTYEGLLEDLQEVKATCSTTLLLGTLDLNGNCKMLKGGDSSVILFDVNGEPINPQYTDNSERTRFFLRLSREERASGSPFIKVTGIDKSFMDKVEVFTNETPVKAVLFMSDGVSDATIYSIKNTYKQFMKKEEEGEDIIRQISLIPQRTGDDKSMGVIEIRDN